MSDISSIALLFSLLIILKNASTSTHCGQITFNHLKLSNGSSKIVNIYEGIPLPQWEFESIYKKISLDGKANADIQILSQECSIEICGYPENTLGYGSLSGNCYQHFNTKKIDLPQFRYGHFIISSISCGCEKQRPGCSLACTSRYNISKPDVCGILYQEDNCNDCFYDEISMMVNERFTTKNAVVIRSLLVRPECMIREYTSGVADLENMSTQLDYPSSTSFHEIGLSPSFTRAGEEYYCYCKFPVPPLPFVPTTNVIPTIANSTTTTTTTTFRPFLTTRKTLNNTTKFDDLGSNSGNTTTKTLNMTTKFNHLDSNNENTYYFGMIEAFVIGSIALIISIIMLWIWMHFRRHRKNATTFKTSPVAESVHSYPRHLLPKRIIKEFKEGIPPTTEEIELTSLPKGFKISRYLPYNNKTYELDRSRVLFDPEDPSSLLGWGFYGAVYRGSLLSVGDQTEFIDVVIKITKPLPSKYDSKTILNEIKLLSYVGHHEHIVKFLGACTENMKSGEIFIVLELCPGGSIKDYLDSTKESLLQTQAPQLLATGLTTITTSYFKIKSEQSPTLPQDIFNKMILWSEQISNGMDYLTNKDVLHMDLAARNILLTETQDCKICDLGLSRKLYDSLVVKQTEKDLCMPWASSALESLKENKYSVKSDIWAYGVLLWELFSCGDEPYGGLLIKSPHDLITYFETGRRLHCPKYLTEDSEIFLNMLQCWNSDPDMRPSFLEMKVFFESKRMEYTTEINYV